MIQNKYTLLSIGLILSIITACAGGTSVDKGPVSDKPALSELTGLVFDYNNFSDDGTKEESYYVIDDNGYVTDYHFMGDEQGIGMNCYSVNKDWGQFIDKSFGYFDLTYTGLDGNPYKDTLRLSGSGNTLTTEFFDSTNPNSELEQNSKDTDLITDKSVSDLTPNCASLVVASSF